MKIKSIISVSILSVLLAFATMAFKMMANPLAGKWQVNSKAERKYENGVVMELSEKNYKPGKKSFEFAPENKLIIMDDYGKVREKKKYEIEGTNVYIGKEKKPDNLYTCTFSADNKKVTLSRTKTKVKEKNTTVETDEIKLERIN